MTSVALHVGQLLQPVPGGIGTYVGELLAALPAHGIDLQTFAAGNRPDECSAPYTDLGFPRGSLRYESWLRLRRPRLPFETAVVHGPSLAVPPRLTRGGDAALVVTVHDVAFLRFPQHFTNRGVAFHRRGLAVTRQDADIVITPSEFTRQELGREGFDLERIVAIPHGIAVPTPPDSPTLAAILAEHELTTPFILAVGTIEPRKGFDVVAAAMDAFTPDDLTLVIVGPHGWNEVSGLDRANVRVLGRVDTRTLDALYRAALACVVPSEYEGFGLPALEAMARSCPVLVSDTSSLPEVVGDAGVLLPFGDSTAWADAIKTVLHDPEHRSRLAAGSRSRAATFTWSSSAAAHAAVYERAQALHANAS